MSVQQQFRNFCRKHVYKTFQDISFTTIFKSYRFLPTCITVLKDIPDIEDYYLLESNNYRSKSQINCFVINTVTNTVTELVAFVNVSFSLFDTDTFLPVHISHVDFDTAYFYESYNIEEISLNI